MMKEISERDDSKITPDKGFVINNVYSVGEPIFRGVYVPIDKVFFTHEDRTKEVARDWLKEVIKEAIAEMNSGDN